MINNSMFVLAVQDLQKSGAFYRDVLGFQIHEMGDPGWRLYERDHCKIMVGECRDAMPASQTGDHSFFAYLTVDDVDSFYQQVIAANAEITKSIRDEPWGMREFGLRTVDGHRIMFGMSK